MIGLVVAYSENGVIGRSNDLPWYLPADLRRFKLLTSGHAVIMGRKTFESIISRLGHPLPDRKNIVLSSRPIDVAGVYSAISLPAALKLAEGEDAYVIGGAQVFADALSIADRLYATEIHARVDGDVFFPNFDRSEWTEIERSEHKADAKNPFDYAFVTYERKRHG